MSVIIPFRLPKIGKYFMLFLPILEIVGFIVMGSLIGILPTIFLIILTTLFGFYVLRNQGAMAIWQMDKRLNQQASPLDMMDSSFLMFAGLLLILPGFITDLMGLLLLIKPLRQYFIKWLLGHNMARTPQKEDVLEGEYWEDESKTIPKKEKDS